MLANTSGPFAVVTGGSSGIGYALAAQFMEHGYDVLIAADVDVQAAQQRLQARYPQGAVIAITADLATTDGIHTLYAAIRESGRGVDALAANAGIGLGQAFLDQRREDWIKIIETNVIGTLDIIHLVGSDMRAAGTGKILITSSIASQAPSPFLALYSASKSFLQSFSFAIRNELKDTGVTVTALLPGATETEIWERAGVTDTELGGQAPKDDAADVAKSGFEALMAGQGEVVHGWKNKLAVAGAKLVPDAAIAAMTRRTTEPGSGG